ncbi:MAG: GIY-YIG nuclease family protein, partial [Treponema sp.]|nr:GIY-YIG nuclease family protein [Treponema sp.]
MNAYYVYTMFNKQDNVLYVGITNDIYRRMAEHKSKVDKKSFTARYNVDKLRYFELHGDIDAAIAREKQIKVGSRDDKIQMIGGMNPDWRDLAGDIINILNG